MLERLTVKNYKSLRDTQITLKSPSVLVGPNASGKSNLFDAIRFLVDLARVGQEAVNGRGGFKTIVWSGQTERKISFDLRGKLRSDESLHSFAYSIELCGQPYESFEISRESFGIYQNNEFRTLLEFPDKNRTASIYNLEGTQVGACGSTQGRSYLYGFSPYRKEYSPLAAFSNYLQSWEVYDPIPALMRGSVQVKRELKLAPHGENLAGVLHTLHSEFPEIFKTMEGHLQVLMPESRKLLSLLTEKGQTYPGLEENTIPSKIPASSLSAGTLRFLAFLAALYSPEAPPLVCFEEPENNIHPHALELLMDVLKTASQKRQVLIATHSPYLLNFVDPHSVFVFEKIRGETKVVRASTKRKLKSLLRKVGLGEAWYAGTLGGVPVRTE